MLLPRRFLLAITACLALGACGGDPTGPPAGDVGGHDDTDTGCATTVCNGVCVDTADDDAHCGACDRPCAAGETCDDGTCVIACPGDATGCDGSCVDTGSDVLHCGGCDRPCAAGETCDDGTCVDRCEAGERVCDDGCVDPTTDPLHCGSCNRRCAGAPGATATCVDSTCGIVCDDGFVDLDPDAPGCEYACTATADVEALCDGVDDDCDGAIDGDDVDLVPTPCARTVGVCAGAVARCDAGRPVCDGDVYRAAAGARPWQDRAESWCDGFDNDCDGETDEGCCEAPDAPFAAPTSDPRGPVAEQPVAAFAVGDGLHVITRYADLRVTPRVLAARLHRVGPAGGVDPAPLVLDDDRVYEVAVVPLDDGYGLWIVNESGLVYGEFDLDGAVRQPVGPVDGLTDRYTARLSGLSVFAQPGGASLIAVVETIDDEVLGRTDVTELLRWDGTAITGFYRVFDERLSFRCAAPAPDGFSAIAVQRGRGTSELIAIALNEDFRPEDRDSMLDVAENFTPSGYPVVDGCAVAAVESGTGARYLVTARTTGNEAIPLPDVDGDATPLGRSTAGGFAATGGVLHAWARAEAGAQDVVVRHPEDADALLARFDGPAHPRLLVADAHRTWLVATTEADDGTSVVEVRPLSASGGPLCVDADDP